MENILIHIKYAWKSQQCNRFDIVFSVGWMENTVTAMFFVWACARGNGNGRRQLIE